VRYFTFALERVRRFRSVISDLAERDYPFRHSQIALSLLSYSFAELEEELESAQNASEATRVALAQRTLEEIYIKLPVLGLIERSSDVIGPVEFHGPFCRLIRAILGSQAKLILSADWDYSPYTYIYPGLFPDHHFVIVALPYSEAGQVLGLPLAGHELGHNVWAAESLARIFSVHLAETITTLISGDFKDLYDTLSMPSMEPQDGADLFRGTPIWHEALKISLKQVEELFCDFFGISLFGSSYLSAFEYLTAPWSFERVPEYPSMADRLSAQAMCAGILKIDTPAYYNSSGIASHAEDNILLQIADVATKRQIPRLIDSANEIVRRQIKTLPTLEEQKRICSCFNSGYPATDARTVADILNAAWMAIHDRYDRISLINEVTLKTLEVFEIEMIQDEAKRCSIQAK
jgi:hypothetical protein